MKPQTKDQLAAVLNAGADQVKHALERLRRGGLIFQLADRRRWALEEGFTDCPDCRGHGWEDAGTASTELPPAGTAVVGPSRKAVRICGRCGGKGWVTST